MKTRVHGLMQDCRRDLSFGKVWIHSEGQFNKTSVLSG